MSEAAKLVVPQRRNVAVLALAQGLFISIQGMGAAATPLAGYALLGADEKWLATVPVFLMQLGIMVATIPASFLMAAIGRRGGFSIGALLGVVAGLIGCSALYQPKLSRCCASPPCCRACRPHSSGISAWPPPTRPSRAIAPRRSLWSWRAA